MKRILLLLGSVFTCLSALFAKTIHDEVPRRVDADGHRLLMLVSGQGTPAVVFESGLGGGGGLYGWNIHKAVGRLTRVVSYSRAGMEGSEPGPKPRTAQQIAREMHTSLRNANVAPPYVLVGHSFGGPCIRVYAHLFPEDVAGLVLVDPAQEQAQEESEEEFPIWLEAQPVEKRREMERILAKAREEMRVPLLHTLKGMEEVLAKEPEERRESIRREWWCLLEENMTQNETMWARIPEAMRDEFTAFPLTIQQARAAWPLPDVPIILLTGMKVGAKGSPAKRALEAAVKQDWLKAHRDWLKKLPNARHIVLEESGHNIAVEAPEVVMDAIRQVVEQAHRR